MTDQPPKISVITPTFNRLDVLKRAVCSLESQSFPDFEHIIVDDGSTDGTGEWLSALTDPRFRGYSFSENRGANTARNMGLEMAKAPLVAFLDSDDEFLGDRLQSVFQTFEGGLDIDLIISSYFRCERGKMRACVNAGGSVTPDQLERSLVGYTLAIAGSAISARKNLLLDAGGFDPSLKRMQDRDLLLRLARDNSGRSFAYLSDTPDWTKHDSEDAISGSFVGYATAFNALIERHPNLETGYRDLVLYNFARRLMKALRQGQLAMAWREFRQSRRTSVLGVPLQRLFSAYLNGRRQRRSFAQGHTLQDVGESADQKTVKPRAASHGT
ncbi:MAG: glycosyltransferase [Pseudomonadota bacterium]